MVRSGLDRPSLATRSGPPALRGLAAERAIQAVIGQAGPIAIAVLALGLAQVTLLPGVTFWDTGEFQTVPPLLGTLHPTGFPAYTILGWIASVVLQPFGEPALRMNLFSAICVAGAVLCTVVLVRQLTGRSLLAIVTGLVLFLTGITWDISTHADAHSLHLLLVCLLLVLLVGWEERTTAGDGPRHGADRWLIGAAAVYAVAVANHSLALLFAPGIVLFVVLVDPAVRTRLGLVARGVGVFVAIVVALYLELPLRAGPFRAPIVYGHPESWGGFWYVVLAQQFLGDLGTPLADLGSKVRDLITLAATQLGPLAALVPPGLAATVIRRPRYAALTIPTLAITCFFAISYSNAEIERYYLGPLVIALTWVAILADGIVDSVAAFIAGRSRDGWGQPSASSGAALALEFIAAVLIVAPALSSAEATSVAVDEHRMTAAADWLDQVLAELPQDAVVVSWWGYSTPLWYAQEVQGRRRDVTIVDDRNRLDENLGDVTAVIDSYLGLRPVYVIRLPAETAALANRYDLVELPDRVHSGLSRVVDRRSAAAP